MLFVIFALNLETSNSVLNGYCANFYLINIEILYPSSFLALSSLNYNQLLKLEPINFIFKGAI